MFYGNADYTDDNWHEIRNIRDQLEALLPSIKDISETLDAIVPIIDKHKRGRKTNFDKKQENLYNDLNSLPHGQYGNLVARIETAIQNLENTLDDRDDMLKAEEQEIEETERAEYERLREKFGE